MKTKGDPEFSWVLLFAVTSGSFFIFSLLIKLLEGSSDHVSLFFKTGIVSLGLTIIVTISGMLAKTVSDD